MTIIDKTSTVGRKQRPAEVSPDIKVWDIAVRLIHWSLVASFAVAWLTADEWDRIHEIAGYAIGGLVGFRLVWGFIGSKHARFSDFLYRPSSVFEYLRNSLIRKAQRYIGHNPAGGAMVVALLLSLITVTVSGIAMTTQSFWGVEWVEELHEVSTYLTITLVVLHVAGVAFASLEHRENLVRSMITGVKRRSSD